MAVIQYTALVNQVRGKLNGSVMNKSRTINTVQKKQQQPKGQRGFQPEIRQSFSYYQRVWKELTPVQQTSWQTAASFNPARDRFGNQVILSGYNQFIKAGVLSFYASTPFSFNAYPAAAPTKAFEISDLLTPAFFYSESGGVGFSVYVNDYSIDSGAGYGFIFDISLPISGGVTSYHGRWVNVAGSVANDDIITNISQDLGTYYPMPAEGQRVLWRARLVHIQSGATVVEQQGTFTDWVYQPFIESFTVEPSSGLPPYRFNAIISNKGFVDNVNYVLRSFYSSLLGSCPLPNSVISPAQFIANGIMSVGYYDYTSDVPSGYCYGWKLQLVRVADGHVIQESVVYISNL